MIMMKKMRTLSIAGIAIVGGAAGPALAYPPVTFSGSSGNLSASATFAVSGTDLVVTLTNTSLFDVLVPADVLTAVFFDVAGPALSLTPVSAIVPSGHVVLFGTGPQLGPDVSGEWAYRGDLAGTGQGGTSYGIGSAGFDLFGPPHLFPGPNLHGPVSPDGLQYGLVSAGDDPTTGNAGVTGHLGPLIKYEVVFTLSGLPPGFDPSASITNVWWQYGTDLGEPHFPAPGTLALFGLGSLIALRRRR